RRQSTRRLRRWRVLPQGTSRSENSQTGFAERPGDRSWGAAGRQQGHDRRRSEAATTGGVTGGDCRMAAALSILSDAAGRALVAPADGEVSLEARAVILLDDSPEEVEARQGHRARGLGGAGR